MSRSNVPSIVLGVLVGVGIGAWVSPLIHLAPAQEGARRQGGERPEGGGGQRPDGGEGDQRPENGGGGQSTVHHHYYYGASGANSGGPSYYGQGADLSGVTNPAAARGEEREDTANAALTATQAAHQSQENHNYAVNSYYQNKNVHDQYMSQVYAAGKVTESEAEFMAKQASPGRLSDTQIDRDSDVIHWPPLLRDQEFSEPRYNLDQLYHSRTADNSGVDSDNFNDIQKNCDAMHDILKGMIDKLAPQEYVAANHFIKSLAYEGKFAAK